MNDPIVFDKAKWHHQGEFPKDLKKEQAFVHTGLFLGWLIDNALYSREFADDFEKEIGRFKARRMTGPRVFRAADGVFAGDMLNREGLAFAKAYFKFGTGEYLQDYERTLASGLPTLYHVQDSWENYERLKPKIDERFAEWRKKRRRT